MNRLQVSGLSKSWGNTHAVDNISFAIRPGEFIALLGPSGCGKSTTLRMIAGLESPTHGLIKLNGTDITHLPAGKRGFAMVFQSYALFPHLNVEENILFGLKARHTSRAECRRRLERATELVDLSALLKRKPSQLSGGQCQRVALARAVVAEEAPLCLMDEPLSNLDARLRNEMRAELRELQQKLEMTVLYVTHDQIEAMSMADRILLLDQGKSVQFDTPQTIYRHPATEFAAHFVGSPSMNLLTRINYRLGIRPEAIELCRAGTPAHIASIDYHGADTYIQVITDNKETLTLRHSTSSLPAIGSRVFINWPTTAEHYFGIEDGIRLDSCPFKEKQHAC